MILIQIAIISFLVFAIHYVFQRGEIFGFVDKWYEDIAERAAHNNNMWLYNFMARAKEPLFACPVCMAPWHGTYLYWFIQWPHLGLPTHHLCAWLVIIISCLGLNSIIVRIFNTDD